MKRLALCLLAFLATPLAAGPQERAPVVLQPFDGPLTRVVYDVGTRRAVHLDALPDRADQAFANARVADSGRATANCFLNTRTMGYFVTATTSWEWRDWAAKGTGKSGLVTRYFLAYHTTSNDPSVGGPGASIEVAAYSGETGFCAATGMEVAKSRFVFTGLPGVGSCPASVTKVGFLTTLFLPVDSLPIVPDGPIGWSFGFIDDDGSGSSLTGPLMTSFVSENTGAQDAFDVYNARPSTSGTCIATFFFGGCEPLPQPAFPVGTPCANFYIGFQEVDGSILASTSHWNPSGCNSDSFLTTFGPIVGQGWKHLVSPVTQERVGYAVSLAGQSGGSGSVCRSGVKPAALNGTALYAFGPYVPGMGPRLYRFVGTAAQPASDPTALSATIPPLVSLIGTRYCTQGFGIDFAPIQRFGLNAEVIQLGIN